MISGVKVPLSILGAEIDHISPPELIKQFEAALNAIPEVRTSDLFAADFVCVSTIVFDFLHSPR